MGKIEMLFDSPIHVGRPNIGHFDKYIDHVKNILTNKWLSNDGVYVRDFEKKICDYLGVKNAVVMGNGTIALEIAIRALGLTGEVIVPSYTFIATAHSVYWQGLTPVFADIYQSDHCIDADSVRRLITPKTTGIIGVHLWGKPANIDELNEIAEEHNIQVLFDAAHAFGVSRNGTMIGNFGRCEIFSFHATKFLNSHEGGAVTTNDDELAEKMRLIRNFGFKGYDNVIHPGINGKMVEVCAAMGLINLESVDVFIERNKENFYIYKNLLSQKKRIKLLEYDEGEKNNWQYIVIEVIGYHPYSRDQLIARLHSQNVLARRYFWPGCHNMRPYKELYPWADHLLPNTKLVADRVIVLPTGSSISASEIEKICSLIE